MWKKKNRTCGVLTAITLELLLPHKPRIRTKEGWDGDENIQPDQIKIVLASVLSELSATVVESVS